MFYNKHKNMSFSLSAEIRGEHVLFLLAKKQRLKGTNFRIMKGMVIIMKNLTKTLALCLALVVCIGLFAACGSNNNSASDAEVAPVSDAVSESEPNLKGNLVMATNAYFPPYEFYENDKIVGIDAEVAEKIAEKLGMTLEIEDMEFGSIITAVQTGKVDMGMAGMTVNEDRLKNVDFSISYATGIQSVIVKEDSDIKTLDDLADKQIGVQENTTGDIYVTDEYGEDFVNRYSKGTDAVLSLTQGKIDCVIIDNEPAKSFVAANEGLAILDTEYAVEQYAIAIAKDSELLEKINTALEELIADGTLDEIINKYIPANE